MTDQHLRNYKILKQLGEGGMATVYLAEHLDLGHSVAIKILNKEFTHNKNIRNRFIDEAKKMVRMNHPNVVKVADLINDPDTVAIVMEYVDGETLRDVLSRKKLTDSEIENYLKQMVAALEYVHIQGLVHRDIKPSNFIFNVKGVLKLTDFGISKSIEGELDGHTQTGTAMSMGTPMYMSPEQVRSIKDVTYLSDIYSLGVVLYQMVSGQKPYPIDTLSAFDLQLKIVQEKLPLTGTNWDSTIQKATEKFEEKRFQSAGEVLLENKSLEKKESDSKKVDEDRTVAFVRPEIKKATNKIKEKPKKNKKLFFWIGGVLFSILLIAYILVSDKSLPLENNIDNDLYTEKLYGRVKEVSEEASIENAMTGEFEKAVVFMSFGLNGNFLIKTIKRNDYYLIDKYNNHGEISESSSSASGHKSNRKYEYEYNQMGHKIKSIHFVNDMLRQTRLFEYDNNGNIIKEKGYNDWDSLIFINTFIYDYQNRKIEENDVTPKNDFNSKILYSYDNKSNPIIEKQYINGQSEGFSMSKYDEYGNITSLNRNWESQLASKSEYEYEYDEHHNWIKQTEIYYKGDEEKETVKFRKIKYY